jgi:hypothetical protein
MLSDIRVAGEKFLHFLNETKKVNTVLKKISTGPCLEGNEFNRNLLLYGKGNLKLNPLIECTLIFTIQGVSFIPCLLAV